MSSFISNALTALVASGQSLSNSIHTKDAPVVAVIPGANTVSFQGSMDNVNFYNLYNDSSPSAEYSIAGASGCMHPVNFNFTLAPRWVKVRIGTAGSPVTVSGDTLVTVITKEI